MSVFNNGFMKMICLIFFTIFVAIAFANDSTMHEQNNVVTNVSKKELSPKMAKSTTKYLQAKRACLKESAGSLKGKLLADCIVKYQKEAK